MAFWPVGAFIVFLFLVGVFMYVVTVYNNLVQVKHNVDQAWANIDVLLKQRHDEIPKLIDTAKAYMAYEQELLQQITTLRSRATQGGDEATRLHTEQQLGAALGRLFAVAEQYPDLKANQNFLALQSRISSLEEQIAHRREFYNESVNINNVRMEQVPDVLFARVAGLQTRTLFEATPEERGEVDITKRFAP